MTPRLIVFLNWDLWLEDNSESFLVMDGMASLFLSCKKFDIFTLKMKSSIYLHCCRYVLNVKCFLFFSVILDQNLNNKWKEWIWYSEWCRSDHKKQINDECVRLVFRSWSRFVLVFDFNRLKYFSYGNKWWKLTIWEIMPTLLSMNKLKK